MDRRAEGHPVFLVVLLVIAMARPAASSADSDAGPAKAEAVPVPQGFRGLRFGMSPEQVRKALTDAMGWETYPKALVKIDDPISGSKYVELPVSSFGAALMVGELPAQCTFQFVEQRGLTRMSCTLVPAQGHNRCRVAVRSVLETLLKKYGEPRYLSPPDKFPWECEWKDDAATLNLAVGCPEENKTGWFALTNESAEHQRLLRQFEDNVRREIERKGKQLQSRPRRFEQDL